MPRFLAPGLLLLLWLPTTAPAQKSPGFLLKKDDRVAIIGSSSTNIGIWPKTLEFLLRTRQPELNLSFKRFSTGGGTFATGLKKLDSWLDEYKPTVVIFNYGGNDASAGEKGLAQFLENMETCVERVHKAKARVIFTTPQAADVRKAKELPASRRKLYAETMLKEGAKRGWDVIDVFHPLDELQSKQEKKDPKYTILRDNIHLTPEAYIAWGYFLYKRLHPPSVASTVHLNATGAIINVRSCKVDDVKVDKDTIRFTRRDAVLPLVPPGPLPPLDFVPVMEFSNYWLQIGEMKKGIYQIRVEGKLLGDVTHEILARGFNLNELAHVNKMTPPWAELVLDLWDGKNLDRIGNTSWRFEVSPKILAEK